MCGNGLIFVSGRGPVYVVLTGTPRVYVRCGCRSAPSTPCRVLMTLATATALTCSSGGRRLSVVHRGSTTLSCSQVGRRHYCHCCQQCCQCCQQCCQWQQCCNNDCWSRFQSSRPCILTQCASWGQTVPMQRGLGWSKPALTSALGRMIDGIIMVQGARSKAGLGLAAVAGCG